MGIRMLRCSVHYLLCSCKVRSGKGRVRDAERTADRDDSVEDRQDLGYRWYSGSSCYVHHLLPAGTWLITKYQCGKHDCAQSGMRAVTA